MVSENRISAALIVSGELWSLRLGHPDSMSEIS